jgi:Fic family protein
VNRLQAISSAKEWLQQLRPLPRDVVEELRHRYEVRFTYHSTAIEGNTLTQSETQIVIETGMTIAGKTVAEHLETIGHKEALDFVLELADASAPISEREIREIYSLVMKGEAYGDTGAYRTLDVRAAGTEFVYPSHLHLHELMGSFMSSLVGPTELHPIEFASEAHLRFVSIHPFRDGNGRIGRLLLNLLLLRSGYPIAVIPVGRRSEYIDALVSAQESGDRTALDRLVLDAVEESLRDTLATALSSATIVVEPELRSAIRGWLS